MKFTPLGINGAFEITPDFIRDDRGHFARTFCEHEFAAAGLATRWAQMNLSHTRARATLRGLHFQRDPAGEAKLIRATRGRVFDVLVDLRADSPTFGQYRAVELDADAGNAVHIPIGCAHGFQTLSDDATLHYCHSHRYSPDLEGGVCPLDPDLAIAWPLPIAHMSERDRSLPPLKDIDRL
jgi:dTDP-4-dehydrorhamnose 3,5-epimerase